MIVSVILNTEYMKVEERIKWFLKSASYAKKQDIILVTHEYMKTHLREMIEKLGDRFYGDYEMDHLSFEEVEKMDICYIPDEIFDSIYEAQGCQTRALLYLSNERVPEIEKYVIDYIDRSLQARGLVKPEYIEYCLHTFASVRYIAQHYDTPLLPYVFSAVRMVHGYTQTLYMAHFDQDLFGSKYAEELYKEYDPKKVSFPILNKHEIMALLGKKRNLPLIPLMDIEPKYEMGVMVEGFQIIPQSYQYDMVTDDDLYFEANRWYSNSEVLSRVHPIKMDRFGITRKHMKNDPAPFLINCKRFSTVQSQMITKAAMWNRVPCVLGSALPYAFLFTSDFRSNEVVSVEKLNFLLFCYFVPDCCMFDSEYWVWRKTNPAPEKIIDRHISAILKQLGYGSNLLDEPNGRLDRILQGRGCSQHDIEQIKRFVKKEDVVYECMSSRIDLVDANGTSTDIYCRNTRTDDGEISSRFVFNKGSEKAIIKLLDDVDGYVTILGIRIDAEDKGQIQRKYVTKGESICDLDINGATEIEIKWSLDDYESTHC